MAARKQQQGPRAGLHLVLDPKDPPSRHRFITSLHDLERGQAVVEIVPGTSGGRFGLARTVLASLGKSFQVSGSTKDAQHAWEQATVWLCAHRVRRLIVARAHGLDGEGWQQLLELAAVTGAELWLIANTHALRSTQARVIAGWPVTHSSVSDLRRRFRARSTSASARGAPTRKSGADQARPLPAVPGSDFTTFRADCRALLSDVGFKRVDREFLGVFKQTRAWLRRNRQPTKRQMTDYLQDLVRESTGLSGIVIATRACQVACFHAGYLLKVDLDRLAASAGADPGHGLAAAELERLDIYPSPRHAATGVIAGLSRLPQSELVTMDLGDVAGDGASFQVGGRRFDVPERVRPALRALYLERTLQSAQPDDPYFVYARSHSFGRGHDALRRATAHSLQLMLRAIADETGLMLTAGWTSQSARLQDGWLERRGLSFQPLDSRRVFGGETRAA